MIVYGYTCPIDGLTIDMEDTPLAVSPVNFTAGCAVGKHLHWKINQSFTCGNGHTFTVTGELLLVRSA